MAMTGVGNGAHPDRTLRPVEIAVVIPAFNEASTIAKLVTEVAALQRNVIVVDDGSTDTTADILFSLPIPVRVLTHATNMGKSTSLVAGIQAAKELGASAVITLDADGQHRPEDIPRFIEKARRAPGKIITGNRLADRSAIPPARYHANTIANFWISWACGYLLADSQSGFRFYPREVLDAIEDRYRSRRGFVFESEILIDAARLGISAETVDIPAIYAAAELRPSHFRPVLDITRIAIMLAWKLISRGMYPKGLLLLLRAKRAAGPKG